MSRDLVILPRGVRLAPGQEWWEDTPHRLAARLRADARAGRVREVARFELAPGRHGAVVVRLKPRPGWGRVAASATAVGVGIMGGVAAATWWVAVHLEEILTVLFAATLGGLLLAALTRFLGGHRPTCAGLHCPGCRR